MSLARDRFTWLAYGQIAVFGYFFYGFGPVVPLLRLEQHTSRGVAALHGTAFAVGALLCGTLAPVLVRRFGRQVVVWLGLAGVSLMVLGFWLLRPLWATLLLAVLAAFFGTFVVNIVMAALSDHHGAGGPAAISEGNAVAAGIGLLAPLAMGAMISTGWGWRPGLALVAGFTALLAVLALVLRVRTPDARPVPSTTTAGRLPRSFRIAWWCVLATGSVEVSLNLWVADVLRVHSHASTDLATAALSAVVAGMCLGRLAGGRILLRWPPPQALLGALSVSALGFAVFWLAPVSWLAFVGLVILGLGNSLHFPLGVALAVAHSGGQPDLAMARLTYAAGTAVGLAPFVLGLVADRVGPHLAFLLVPVCLAAAATAAWRLRTRVPVAELAPAGMVGG
jgi:predicted MFS family arabinose efflux permease